MGIKFRGKDNPYFGSRQCVTIIVIQLPKFDNNIFYLLKYYNITLLVLFSHFYDTREDNVSKITM